MAVTIMVDDKGISKYTRKFAYGYKRFQYGGKYRRTEEMSKFDSS